MILKKNAFSYVIWMIILFFTGAVFSFFGMISANLFNVNMYVVAAGFVVGLFGILFLIYVLTGIIGGFRAPIRTSKFWKKAAPYVEIGLVLLSLAGGIAFRVYLLPLAGEEAAYFEVSKVTGQSGIMIQSVQGSVYYYCLLLHGLFMIVGNHWIAGIWLQIVLQIIGAIALYSAVRKLTDRWPALIVLGYMLFSPSSVEAGLTYSPQILYFCLFAVVLLLIADYMKRSSVEEQYPVFTWIYTVLIGLAIGFCCYVDVTGCLLFLLIACLPMVDRENDHKSLWLIRLFLIVAVAVGTFFATLLLDGIISGTSFVRVLNAWLVTYGSFSNEIKLVTEQSNVDLFVVIGFVCLGVFSFWRRRKEERFTPFVLLGIGISLLCLCGITTANMSGIYLLHVLLTALAAVALTELFYTPPMLIGKEKVVESMEIIDLEKQDITKEGVVVNQQTEQAEESKEAQKPRYIENPLPVPKKHVRKVMDYAFTPDNSKMFYDVRVPDNDDYDLK